MRQPCAVRESEPHDMPVYRLDPLPDAMTSHHWRASTIEPMSVWVQAPDETTARERVTLATIIATRFVPGQEIALPPWKDEALASCFEDRQVAVSEGVVLLNDGRTLSVRET